MSLTLIWAAVSRFAKAVPGWVWWVIIAIAFGKFIDMRARADQIDKDKAREKLAQAKAQAGADKATIEIKQENVTDAKRAADAAAAVPKYANAAELQHDDPELAAELGIPNPGRTR